jgi:serine/threonine protein phosphatase PrpC
MIHAAGASDTGCVRQNNEDRILLNSDLGLFVVADGMGGHSHGERAAELAISTLEHYVESSCNGADVTWPFGYNFQISFDSNRLATAVQLANGQVWRCSQQAPEFAGMGTTVAAVIVSGSGMSVANVGDSRVYLMRDGALQQLSVDDTWISAVGARGAMTKEQIQNHPMRNFLTQAAGSKQDLDVHTREVELRDSDHILVCSDGLHGAVDEAAITFVLRENGGDLRGACDALVRAAKSAGGLDNVSCIVITYKSETA